MVFHLLGDEARRLFFVNGGPSRIRHAMLTRHSRSQYVSSGYNTIMPIEIFIAVLVASSCIVVLTMSLLVTAVYFLARVNSMERKVTRLEGDLSGLIHESHGLVRNMQQVAVRATRAMEDVEQMTRIARGWTNRADRMVDVVAIVTEPSMQIASKYLKYGSGFLNGVMQVLLTRGNKS
ncbi:MAG: hypothetical protein IT440_11100 [Phycisphaeraceae bacterium]|nr:hypothetical protein [Phycisphaeraceae bacterium]